MFTSMPLILTAAFGLTQLAAGSLGWTGTMAAPATNPGHYAIQGTVEMEPFGPQQTHVQVRIENTLPGEEYSWSLHRGACGADDKALAATTGSGTLVEGGGGTARSAAVFGFSLPAEGRFHVSVRANNGATPRAVVACAELRAP